MRDRAAAYAMLALLLALFWGVLTGIVVRAVWSENNPTHEWGEQFEPAWLEQQRTMPTPRDSWSERFKPQPYVTDQPTCEWMCSRSGLCAQWAARDVPCVCGVAP